MLVTPPRETASSPSSLKTSSPIAIHSHYQYTASCFSPRPGAFSDRVRSSPRNFFPDILQVPLHDERPIRLKVALSGADVGIVNDLFGHEPCFGVAELTCFLSAADHLSIDGGEVRRTMNLNNSTFCTPHGVRDICAGIVIGISHRVHSRYRCLHGFNVGHHLVVRV